MMLFRPSCIGKREHSWCVTHPTLRATAATICTILNKSASIISLTEVVIKVIKHFTSLEK
jgi:hypothetical protein